MKTLLNILLVVSFLISPRLLRASEALLSYAQPVLGSFNGTAGWNFQPQTDLSVISLGSFSYLLNNEGSVLVGLWASDGSLLASASVTLSSPTVNQSHYEPITPISLTIGQTYYIGAFAPSGTIGGDFVSGLDGSSAITASEIQLGSVAVATNSIFEFPSFTQGAAGSGFMGPNFEFTMVPEPTTLGLVLLAGAVFATKLRRRMR